MYGLSAYVSEGPCLCVRSDVGRRVRACVPTWLTRALSPRAQGEEAEGDAGDGAAAGQEHEQPAHMAVPHRGRAGQAGGLQRLPQRRDPEEARRAAGTLWTTQNKSAIVLYLDLNSKKMYNNSDNETKNSKWGEKVWLFSRWGENFTCQANSN